jgi:hypothetical protein
VIFDGIKLISKEGCVEKSRQLDLEISVLRPIDCDHLRKAGDMLENFEKYWNKCNGDPDTCMLIHHLYIISGAVACQK